MKLSLPSIILCCLLVYCNNDKHPQQHQQESPNTKTSESFEYHFRILDSVVQRHPLDTLYQCCTPSIDFMEDKTEIEPSSPDDFFGRMYFTKKDWEKWHNWHRNKLNSTN